MTRKHIICKKSKNLKIFRQIITKDGKNGIELFHLLLHTELRGKCFNEETQKTVPNR